MRWEMVKIVVDWFAFLLVTIDLYGRANLERLTNKLRKLFTWSKNLLRYLWQVAILPPGLSREDLRKMAAMPYWERHPTPSVVVEPFGWSGLIRAGAGLMLVGAPALWVALLVVGFMAYGMITVALFLLRLRGAEGLFLLTGAALFTLEKIIEFVLISQG
jgi:hypothetical protein